jgi:hypothetical protein
MKEWNNSAYFQLQKVPIGSIVQARIHKCSEKCVSGDCMEKQQRKP